MAAPQGATDAGAEARAAMGKALATAQAPSTPVPVLPSVSTDPAKARTIANAAQHAAHSRALEARATAAVAAGKAGIVAQSAAMTERLHQALGLAAPPLDAMTAAVPARPGIYAPLLFVSSSMPIDELRTYATQIERTGGALAFRGMPGGLHRVAPMAELSARILRLDPGCSGPACRMRSVPIVVDPIAFRKAGVTAVPALAMVPGDPTTPYCERSDSETAPDILVTGDAALSGLLEEFARLGGSKEVADAQASLRAR